MVSYDDWFSITGNALGGDRFDNIEFDVTESTPCPCGEEADSTDIPEREGAPR